MKTEVSDVDFSYSALLSLARWNDTPGVEFDVPIQKLGEPFATSLEMNVTPLAWGKWPVGD